MRNRKGIMLLIILLAIGFAGVATTLLMSGNVFIGTNESDYKIYFSEAILDDKDKTNSIISANKQVINFETKELTEIGDESVLSFEVTNDSRQYDAEVKFNCQANDSRIFDYVDIVVAPVLIGGKDTSTLIDGKSLVSQSELSQLGVLKLQECVILENSYLRLRYEVIR